MSMRQGQEAVSQVSRQSAKRLRAIANHCMIRQNFVSWESSSFPCMLFFKIIFEINIEKVLQHCCRFFSVENRTPQPPETTPFTEVL